MRTLQAAACLALALTISITQALSSRPAVSDAELTDRDAFDGVRYDQVETNSLATCDLRASSSNECGTWPWQCECPAGLTCHMDQCTLTNGVVLPDFRGKDGLIYRLTWGVKADQFVPSLGTVQCGIFKGLVAASPSSPAYYSYTGGTASHGCPTRETKVFFTVKPDQNQYVIESQLQVAGTCIYVLYVSGPREPSPITRQCDLQAASSSACGEYPWECTCSGGLACLAGKCTLAPGVPLPDYLGKDGNNYRLVWGTKVEAFVPSLGSVLCGTFSRLVDASPPYWLYTGGAASHGCPTRETKVFFTVKPEQDKYVVDSQSSPAPCYYSLSVSGPAIPLQATCNTEATPSHKCGEELGQCACPGGYKCEDGKCKETHWAYNDNGEDWAAKCHTGERQSPINIPTAKIAGILNPTLRAELEFGKAKKLKVANTGHGIKVSWGELVGNKASLAIVDDSILGLYSQTSVNPKSYRVPVKPLQFHFHTSSEHLIDGNMSPLELHLVTMVDNTTGAPVPEACRTAPCLAVFGVMFKYQGDPYAPGSKLFDQFLAAAPEDSTKEAGHLPESFELDLSSLFPLTRDYVTYTGSLTTPPCTEGVTWHVFLQSKNELSAAQIDKLQALQANTLTEVECELANSVGHKECEVASGARITNRQIMPINGRIIFASKSN